MPQLKLLRLPSISAWIVQGFLTTLFGCAVAGCAPEALASQANRPAVAESASPRGPSPAKARPGELAPKEDSEPIWEQAPDLRDPADIVKDNVAEIRAEIDRLREVGNLDRADECQHRLDRFQRMLDGDYSQVPISHQPELHAVGMVRGYLAEKLPHKVAEVTPGTAHIRVTYDCRPIVLVLMARDPVKWHVTVAPKVRLQTILLAGTGRHQVLECPKSVTIKGLADDGMPLYGRYVYRRDQTFPVFVEDLRERTGLRLVTLSGIPYATEAPIVVGPEDDAWRVQHVMHWIRDFHEKASEHRRKSLCDRFKRLRFKGIYTEGRGDYSRVGLQMLLAECSPLGPIEGKSQPFPGPYEHVTFDPETTLGYCNRHGGLARFDVNTGRVQQIEHESLWRVEAVAFDAKRRRVVLNDCGRGHFLAYYPGKDEWTFLQKGTRYCFDGLSYEPRRDRLIGVVVDKHRRPGETTWYTLTPDGEVIDKRTLSHILPCRWRGTSYQLVPADGFMAVVATRPRSIPPDDLFESFCYLIDPTTAEVVFSARMRPQSADPLQAAEGPPPALPPEEALKKARVATKYGKLIHQLNAPEDYKMHGPFRDYGFYVGTRWVGCQDRPAGYWVYVYPRWYVWRDLVGAVPEEKRPAPSAKPTEEELKDEAERLLARAEAAKAAGEIDKALQLWDKVVAEYPESRAARRALLAKAWHDREHARFRQAIAACEKLVADEGRHIQSDTGYRALMTLFDCHQALGEYQQAAKYARQIGGIYLSTCGTHAEDHRQRWNRRADELLQWHQSATYKPPKEFAEMLNGLVIAGGGEGRTRALAQLAEKQRLIFDSTPLNDEGLAQLRDLTHLKELRLYQTPLTDAGIKHLRGMKQLESLTLGDTGVTDAGLAYLANLTSLKELSLTRTLVGNAGLAHLSNLHNLRSLGLMQTLVTDDGLAHLSRMTKMRELTLYGTRISDAGLAHLRSMARLETLGLPHTQVRDPGLVHLSTLTGLKRLDMQDTKITGQELKHLAELADLRWLNLCGNEIDDAGLAHLGGLRNLEYLDLSWSNVADAGMSHLRDLHRLSELRLIKTKVTPNGIRRLKNLPSLKGVSISGDMMSWEERDQLQGELPGVFIRR